MVTFATKFMYSWVMSKNVFCVVTVTFDSQCWRNSLKTFCDFAFKTIGRTYVQTIQKHNFRGQGCWRHNGITEEDRQQSCAGQTIMTPKHLGSSVWKYFGLYRVDGKSTHKDKAASSSLTLQQQHYAIRTVVTVLLWFVKMSAVQKVYLQYPD